MPTITLQRRIRWADADAAGIMHYPRMFEYFEEGEWEFLRAAGFDYRIAEGYGMPRRHVEATFHRVLPLDAMFWMRVSIGKLGRTSIRYDYHVYADEACESLALEGTMTIVYTKDGVPCEIPAELRAKYTD